LAKQINSYLFVRYTLVYTIFYFLLSSALFYLFALRLLLHWCSDLTYFFENFALGALKASSHIILAFSKLFYLSAVFLWLIDFKNPA